MAATVKTFSPRGAATRARILAAAVELIADRGVAAVTLDDVQERAQVSRGQLYHYFDGREHLLLAVVDATAGTILDRQAELFAALDTWAGVEAWLDLLADVHRRRGPLGCPLGGLVAQLAPVDEASRVAIAAGFDRWEAALRDGLLALHARGELARDVDPSVLATTLMAGVQGAYVLAQARADTGQFDRAIDGLRHLLAAVRTGGPRL